MIELVDMCSLQDPERVDFKKMKDSGVRGAWLKASQFSRSLDPTFGVGSTRAIQAGLNVGAYHFAYCGSDPVAQMKFAHNACAGLGTSDGELPFMLDWEFAETGSDGKRLTPEAVVDWLWAAAEEANVLWKGKVIIYTYPHFALRHQPFLANSGMEKYDLCLAAYPAIRNVPSPWPHAKVHQYVGNGGKVPGVATDCDRDRFLGTEEEFQFFIGYRPGGGAKVVPDEAETGSGGIIHPLSYEQKDSGAV